MGGLDSQLSENAPENTALKDRPKGAKRYKATLQPVKHLLAPAVKENDSGERLARQQAQAVKRQASQRRTRAWDRAHTSAAAGASA